MNTTNQIETFSGLSHAELVAAYQACRARNAKLERTMAVIERTATDHSLGDGFFLERLNCIADGARAILAEVTP